MAIAFARLGYVKRSDGKNVCCKAAYSGRMRVHFQGHEFQPAHTWNWSNKDPAVHHEIFLPEGADSALKDPETLWNLVERTERRKNSQVAIEMVIALPDDKILTKEDRIELARSFVERHFVKHGLVVQLDVHPPEKKVALVNGQTETLDHNWHAHVLATTRRLGPDGKTFSSHKARDLMPEVRNGFVISGMDWGKLWGQHQNQYFEERGLELRVDPTSVEPQKHLGPVRMRGKRAFELMREHTRRVEANLLASQDPGKILEKLTENQSHFGKIDFKRFLDKFVSPEAIPSVVKTFWTQPALVHLTRDPEKEADTKSSSSEIRYTSQKVLKEEKQALRIAERILERSSVKINLATAAAHASRLTDEQKRAFRGILEGPRFSCVEGYAGSGKSYLLKALCDAYTQQGYTVRGLGPDSATAQVLEEKGLSHSENVYRFLFSHHFDSRPIRAGKEVWVVDEAGKLGNRPFLELLKLAERSRAQLVLSGSSKQLSSVERGHLFTAFSKRFGMHLLEDIQRQRAAEQREIAIRLAKGEIGTALDELVRIGGFKWSGSKEAAMEDLIIQWAKEKQACPDQSLAIVAHSNAEMVALNEMVREVRREWGELQEEEFEVKTSSGRLFVSVGDKVEFRKNDSTLGVTNGLKGTLIDATTKQFVVLVREGGSAREITFDPRKFGAFQLGYASTLNRAQGTTVDRTYVLHSRGLNRPLFYVALTRHTRNATCFVSNPEIYCLSKLKAQLYKDITREITLDFKASTDQLKEEVKLEKQRHLEALKSSHSMADKARGYGLAAWGAVKGQVVSGWERIQDRVPDARFYRVSQTVDTRAEVTVVAPSGRQVLGVLEETISRSKAVSLAKQIVCYPNGPTSPISAPNPGKSNSFGRLSDVSRDLIDRYYRRCDQTSALYTTFQATGNSQEDWRQSCIHRNRAAFDVLAKVARSELEAGMPPKALGILKEQAGRHQAIVEARTDSLKELQVRLSDHVEALTYRLFPDGPTSKDRTTLRFGAKGSLAIKCGGNRVGTFYDFENAEGGGMIKLIKRELGLDTQGAKSWALKFLGEAPSLEVPKSFNFASRHVEPEGNWVNLPMPKGVVSPPLSDLSRAIDRGYKEIARHAYRDVEGNPLFYTLRMIKRDDPSSKMVIPLSYGHRQDEPRKAYWRLKGIEGPRPLYNLHLLKEHPTAKVIIVEGEKTADKAPNLLPDGTICLSWCGGSSAALKTDWSPLYRRNVIIWPDNDQAGYRAADSICSQLRRVGTESVRMVDRESLGKGFPEKWDLADELPEGLTPGRVHRMLLSAAEKSVSVEALITKVGSIDRMWCHEVLWRVEERVRPELEGAGLGEREIQRLVIQEARSIIERRVELEGQLSKQPDMGADVARYLSFRSLLYAAERGRDPSMVYLQELRTEQANRDVESICGGLTPVEELARVLVDDDRVLIARSDQHNRMAKILREIACKQAVDCSLPAKVKQDRTYNLELDR
ncbi:MAG: AAA family ATPase [Candidatus Obscuribacterales bacterium]